MSSIPPPLLPLPPRPRWRRALFRLLAVSAVLLTSWLTRSHWLPSIGTILDIGEPIRKTPALLILPGSEETRPFVAASLIQAGHADLALIPETWVTPDVRNGVSLSTAETTRQILRKSGVPNVQIVNLKGESDSTFGDATALRNYFESHGICDVTIVTNAYHTRRARWIFRQVLPMYEDRLHFYSAPNDFEAETWWHSRKGRQAILSEWLKFAFYLVYHGHGWLWGLLGVGTIAGFSLVRRRFRK